MQKMEAAKKTNAIIQVAPSPHWANGTLNTQRMMRDVIISLIPVAAVALFVFQWYALQQLIICLVSCVAFEALFVKMRNRPLSLKDCSAVVTGIILALSLPGKASWYVGITASMVAIGLGKIIFGGLGMNIFNPAMVGRAFVMLAYPSILAASGYVDVASAVDAITQATPMSVLKQTGIIVPASALFWGYTNGSLGETSAIACIVGGIYLCIRRTASWEIPFSMIIVVALWGGIADAVGPQSQYIVMHHLLGGALLFGAFFIATDPVTSPLTRKGKIIFGVGIGALTMLLRFFSGYPEGVMFAVLLMNAVTPLINRWLVPRPFGKC